MRGTNVISARFLLPAVLVVLGATTSLAEAASLRVSAADVAVIANPESAAEMRTLVRFDLPQELAGSTVEFAVVDYQASVSSSDAAGVLTLDVFPVTTEWDGDTVEWADGWTAAGGDFNRAVHAVWTAVAGESSAVRFDVTDMAAAWVSGTYLNRGLIVRSAPGEVGAAGPADAAGDRGGPVLTIWYTGPEQHGRR